MKKKQKKLFMVMRFICFLTLWLSFSATASVFSQQEVTLSVKSETLSYVLMQIKDQTGVKILYNENLLRDVRCGELHLHQLSVEEALKQVLAGTGFEFVVSEGVIVIREKARTPVPKEPVRVRGKVTDSQNQPLPGVTVRIKGTNLGTSTDTDGIFQVSVPDLQQTLIFTFVGMKAQELNLNGKTELAITMEEVASEMEEVIVTGYSTRKVSEMTGAVQQFKGKEVANSAVGGNLMNALRGHTTGLQITGSEGTPGTDGDLLLRGAGTLYSADKVNTSSSTPLIVIDGVITDYTSINGIVSSSDIADITVLKDAASTAIYGSRAATGVIVVTTKKGIKDKMTVSLNVRMGISLPSFGGLKYMNSQELLQYGEMSLSNWWDNNTALQGKYANKQQFIQDTLGVLRDNFDLTQTTDWRDLSYRTG
ncbi:MAG: carboxypeptidase-like regulatory domain-containing protein [Odoribacter splanchnicus]